MTTRKSALTPVKLRSTGELIWVKNPIDASVGPIPNHRNLFEAEGSKKVCS